MTDSTDNERVLTEDELRDTLLKMAEDFMADLCGDESVLVDAKEDET